MLERRKRMSSRTEKSLQETLVSRIRERKLTGVPYLERRPYETVHAQLSGQAAAAGFVLMKNEGDLLPLNREKPLALYGGGAVRMVKGGTGSGDVNERSCVSIREGLEKEGFVLTTGEWLDQYDRLYEQALQDWKAEVLKKSGGGASMEFFMAYSGTPFRRPAGGPVTKTEADTAVWVLSRSAGENRDRRAEPGDWYLSGEEETMLRDICTLYQNVVVLINTGGVVDLSFLDRYPAVRAVLYISQPGMEGGTAVAKVLDGTVNPGGKLTDTWPYRYEDCPCASSFSRMAGEGAEEKYEEGIYVGYRYYDSFDVPVRYCFGSGLSYTSFRISPAGISADRDGTVHVSASVTNTGAVPGQEVVQVYVSLPVGRLEKEYRRLCAFRKTRLLKAGEEETVQMDFNPMDLASFDGESACWVLEPGAYGIFIGSSLEDSSPVCFLEVPEEKVLVRTEHICPLQTDLTELSLPGEKRSARQAELLKLRSSLDAVPYSCADLETRTVQYDGKETFDPAVTQLADSLTLEQLISLTTGDPAKGQGSSLGSAGVTVSGSAAETSSCAADSGVASVVLADGPAGLRLNQYYYAKDGRAGMLPMEVSLEHGLFYDEPPMEGEKYWQFCTAFPVGTLLAQTWDPDLQSAVGRAVAEEMREFNVDLWLAPGMNIHRSPLCGRNFEYCSEDPLLTGRTAAAIVRGVQEDGRSGATIKHFACNNREDGRMTCNSVLSERALREIYLRGFGIAIRESSPAAIMTSYNLINGVHSANCRDLCMKAARAEFGFQGLIMTDWTTTEYGPDCTAAGCIRAGNDLVMPGQESDHESIRSALADGSLSAEELKTCVCRILRFILSSGRYEQG